MLIQWFEDIALRDRPSVGGKGASLGELRHAGAAVPPGFVVTAAAFESALAALDPDGTIRAAVDTLARSGAAATSNSSDALAAATQVSESIRRRFVAGALPPAVRGALIEAFEKLAGPDLPVAVRSSATCEDSAEASFAGQQDTQLGVRGAAAVIQALCDCWASLYSRESISYRLRLALPERQVAMAVVVQRMLESRSAGVMFTRSPLSGDRSVIVIEASFGLGSALVGGEVTPDKYVVNKVTGDIVQRAVSAKALRHTLEPSGGVRIEAIEGTRQIEPALSDEEIRALAEIAKRIEKHYASPQDIEWAIAPDASGQDQLYLLQSRPETVWAKRDSEPVAKPAARAYDHVLAALGGKKR
jgi:phosphoenolpyruvate synthase/pyruvate phosphate dikinase